MMGVVPLVNFEDVVHTLVRLINIIIDSVIVSCTLGYFLVELGKNSSKATLTKIMVYHNYGT